MKKRLSSSKFSLVALCVLQVGLSFRSEAAPSSESGAQKLARARFVPQNQSVVERLRQQNVGWNRIRLSLKQEGASDVQITRVLKQVRRALAKRSPLGPSAKKPFWPVWGQRATLGTQPLWVFEAATPAPLVGWCFTGMSPKVRAAIEERNKERCLQRVVVVQATAPFQLLAIFDSTD